MKQTSIDQFSSRLAHLLPRLMRECTRYESNYLSEGLITLQQYTTMEFIHQMGVTKMSDLAKAINLQMSSATGMIDRLIKQDLVKRERSEEDRRTVFVDLTKKGYKVLKEIHEQKQQSIQKLFSKLSANERTQYLDIIEKLVGDLSGQSQQKEEKVS